jgi:hypothetical protein
MNGAGLGSFVAPFMTPFFTASDWLLIVLFVTAVQWFALWCVRSWRKRGGGV